MRDHFSVLVMILNTIEGFTGVTAKEVQELPKWKDFFKLFLNDTVCQIIVQGDKSYKLFSFGWFPRDSTLTVIRREPWRNRVEKFRPLAVHRPSIIPERSEEDIKMQRVVLTLVG